MKPATRRSGRWGGEILVAACACLLTMAIVGSAVYLTWRMYDRHALSLRARSFVSSLRNRTQDELRESAAQLKALPKVARYVVPEINRALRETTSEEQMCASIGIAKAFVDDPKIRRRLFRLRNDPRESVAAAAVEALSWVEPPEEAARLLGECLVAAEGGQVPAAVVDEVCGGLVRLGSVGLAEMKNRLTLLSVDRRLWFVRYLGRVNPLDREQWLKVLAADADEDVRAASREAMALATETQQDDASAAMRERWGEGRGR